MSVQTKWQISTSPPQHWGRIASFTEKEDDRENYRVVRSLAVNIRFAWYQRTLDVTTGCNPLILDARANRTSKKLKAAAYVMPPSVERLMKSDAENGKLWKEGLACAKGGQQVGGNRYDWLLIVKSLYLLALRAVKTVNCDIT